MSRVSKTFHPFPRVRAAARVVADARRRARKTRQQLADLAGVPADPGAELIRRIEDGRHPFPHPEHVRRMTAAIGLDPDALFLAQCEDFAELDRRDPSLWWILGGRTYTAELPDSDDDDEVRAAAFRAVRKLELELFQLAQGCDIPRFSIRWSSIRGEHMHPSGASVMGFRPILHDVPAGEGKWLLLWAQVLEVWLGRTEREAA